MDQLTQDLEHKMSVSLDHLRIELSKLRTGRASLSLVEDIKVDYYGAPTPLSQAANLGTPDSKTIAISPWDVSLLPAIEKAIQASDLGLTPSNDGKTIHLIIPPLTQERRQELGKTARKYGEEGKIAIRNVRRECNEKLKAMEKNSDISEDDSRKTQEKVQKITDKFIEDADKITSAKEKDILEV